MSTTRRAVLGAGASLLAGGALSSARAQAAYPTRPVTIIAPAAPGSQTDVFSRVLQVPLSQRLGQPVVIENRPGAGGVVGTLAAVRGGNDGYTIMYHSNSGSIIAPQLRNPMPYVTPRDLTPLAMTLSGPSVIVVNSNIRANTIQDLVTELKANPGKYNLGSHGVGAFSHVAMEMFMAETGTEMVHLPYNGGAQLGTAFLAGDVHIALFDVLSARPLIDGGKGRVLATVGAKRSTVFPNAPLVSETVAATVDMDYWLGVFAPAGTPEPIVERLNAEINAIMSLPENRTRASEASMLTDPIGLPALRAKVAREWEQWGKVIRDRRIVAQ